MRTRASPAAARIRARAASTRRARGDVVGAPATRRSPATAARRRVEHAVEAPLSSRRRGERRARRGTATRRQTGISRSSRRPRDAPTRRGRRRRRARPLAGLRFGWRRYIGYSQGLRPSEAARRGAPSVSRARARSRGDRSAAERSVSTARARRERAHALQWSKPVPSTEPAAATRGAVELGEGQRRRARPRCVERLRWAIVSTQPRRLEFGAAVARTPQDVSWNASSASWRPTRA